MLLQLLGQLPPYVIIYLAIGTFVAFGAVSAFVARNGSISTTHRQLRQLQKTGLVAENSNMRDQYDSQFNVPEGVETTDPIRIKAIYIHPIKSCGHVEVTRSMLTKTGFLYDRSFAFATEALNADQKLEWRFLSQRTKPIMSQIQTELWLPHSGSRPDDPLVQAGGCVVVKFQDPDTPSWKSRLETLYHTWSLSKAPQVSFVVPLQPSPKQIEQFNLSLKSFAIHSRNAQGIDMGAFSSVASALPKVKRFLGVPQRQPFSLFRCTSETVTRTEKNLAPLKHIGTPAVHGYTDQQPVNINSISSVQALSKHLPLENQPLNALRFRANLWVTGSSAYDEESWKRCRIVPKSTTAGPRAKVAPTLSVVCRTSRCPMTNVDPDTGVFSTAQASAGKKKGKPQPTTALVDYRTVEHGNKAALGYIGMHCVPEDSSLHEASEEKQGLYVAVGDEIEVLERGLHLYGSTGDDY